VRNWGDDSKIVGNQSVKSVSHRIKSQIKSPILLRCSPNFRNFWSFGSALAHKIWRNEPNFTGFRRFCLMTNSGNSDSIENDHRAIGVTLSNRMRTGG
jgi:hypothetical protein